MKNLVIIPTYNEADNILLLLSEVLLLDVDVLIVDDNSPDGTQKLILNHDLFDKKIFLLERKTKLGLGSAYREGFQWGIENKYNNLIQMDADFSHQVSDLKELIRKKKGSDVVIGSRYIRSGKIKGWSKNRYLLSLLANTYSRFLTFSKIHDMTSGFRIYTFNALQKIDFQSTKSNGYRSIHNRDSWCRFVPYLCHNYNYIYRAKALGIPIMWRPSKTELDSVCLCHGSV